MKANVLLITDSDMESAALVSAAAEQTGRGLLRAGSGREAFHILESGLQDVDVAVVDVDSGERGLGLAALEAINGTLTHPPMVVLTGLEETYMTPIVRAHGAAKCVAKPFTPEKLAAALEEVCSPYSIAHTSDSWGHPVKTFLISKT